MKTLDHIETAKENCKDYSLFITITIPKSMNRKGPLRQKNYMDNYIKFLAQNFFESAVGAYECTSKGNIHAHLMVEPRNMFPNIQFETNEAYLKATVSILSANLKQRSICDVQIIKSLDNTYKYIHKDIEITQKIINAKPNIRIKSAIMPIQMDVLESEKINYSCFENIVCCSENDIKIKN